MKTFTPTIAPKRNLYKILLLGLLMLGFTGISFGQKQGQALIDSLQTELSKAKEDTNKVNVLNELSGEAGWEIGDLEKAQKYAQDALTLSQKIKYRKGEAGAYANFGIVYCYEGNYSDALENLFTALKISEEIGDKSSIANSYTEIGKIYGSQGNYPKVLEYHLASLKISEEIGDKSSIYSNYDNIAIAYFYQGNYPKALENYFAGLKVQEKIGNKPGIASAYNCIGNVYGSQGNYPEALENYFAGLKISEEIGDTKGLAAFYGNIGNIYSRMGNYHKALENFFASLKIREKAGDKRGIANNYGNIGRVYSSQGKYSEALEKFFSALKISEEIGEKSGIAYAYGNIGDVYRNQGNYFKSIDFQYKSLEIYKEIGYKLGESSSILNIGISYKSILTDTTLVLPIENYNTLLPSIAAVSPADRRGLIRAAISHLEDAAKGFKDMGTLDEYKDAQKHLSEVYVLSGDYVRALDAYKEYSTYKDTVFNEEKSIEISRMEMTYEFEKQQAIDRLESEEREAFAQAEIKRQKIFRNSLMAGLFAFILFSVLIFRQRNKVKKEKNRSENLLLNILPAEVAEELKEKGNTQAKQYSDVSILFTDFVSFTQTAETLSPEKLVQELHECFTVFDNIIECNGLEKIKTIGDAYLAVCGLPVANPLHAQRTVQAALEIRDFIAQRKLKENVFEIRIGVHTGSVVAGIVGVKKFAYDIWGDTVNTAARMESSSEAGKVNISETTYQIVKDDFTCKYRGKIDAKGKGEIDMYFVEKINNNHV